VSINNQNYFSSQKRPFKRKQQQQTYIPYWDMGFFIKHIKKHTFFGKGPSIATCDTVGRNPAALAYKTQGKKTVIGHSIGSFCRISSINSTRCCLPRDTWANYYTYFWAIYYKSLT